MTTIQRPTAQGEKVYFMGIYKKNARTIVLQVTDCLDSLSCETWLYFGQRVNTVKNLRAQRLAILQEINRTHEKNYKHLIIER